MRAAAAGPRPPSRCRYGENCRSVRPKAETVRGAHKSQDNPMAKAMKTAVEAAVACVSMVSKGPCVRSRSFLSRHCEWEAKTPVVEGDTPPPYERGGGWVWQLTQEPPCTFCVKPGYRSSAAGTRPTSALAPMSSGLRQAIHVNPRIFRVCDPRHGRFRAFRSSGLRRSGRSPSGLRNGHRQWRVLVRQRRSFSSIGGR